MITRQRLYVMIILWECATACSHYEDSACENINPIEGDYFSNQWIVHVDGDENTARMIAEKCGCEFVEPVRSVDQQYVWQPTIQELETYKDIVGHEIPKKIVISTFDLETMKPIKKVVNRLKKNKIREADAQKDICEFPPLRSIINLDKFYETKEET